MKFFFSFPPQGVTLPCRACLKLKHQQPAFHRLGGLSHFKSLLHLIGQHRKNSQIFAPPKIHHRQIFHLNNIENEKTKGRKSIPQ